MPAEYTRRNILIFIVAALVAALLLLPWACQEAFKEWQLNTLEVRIQGGE